MVIKQKKCLLIFSNMNVKKMFAQQIPTCRDGRALRFGARPRRQEGSQAWSAAVTASRDLVSKHFFNHTKTLKIVEKMYE